MYRRVIDIGGSRRARRRRWLGTSLLVAAGVLLFSSSALALVKRGHVYESALSFGSKGQGEGQFEDPAGVAISHVGPAAGDIYVVDRGNNRVEQFGPHHEFIAAWGWGVKDANKEYEICKSGQGCQAGTPGSGKGAERFRAYEGIFQSPEAIAVDNSTSSKDPSAGDIYVAATEVPTRSYVYKFGPNGEYMGRLTKKIETEEYSLVDGVSVDPQGQVWVAWRGESAITSFSNAEKNKRLSEEPYFAEDLAEMRPGLAVDSNDNLYLNFEPDQKFLIPESASYEETRYSEEDKGENGEEPCAVALPCFVAKLSTAGAGEEHERPVELGEAFIDGLFGETSDAVAVDPSNNDVYVDHATSVSAYTSSGTLIQSFGSGDLEHGSGVTVEPASGDVYVVDAAADSLKVFTPEERSPPTIDGLAAAKITSGGAELSAQISPAGGAGPIVSFEYGTEPCSGGSCTSVPDAQPLSEGYEDEPASATLARLAPGVSYHYRAVIEAGGETVTSGERTFTTAPTTLADNRAWEMVSPADKNGVGIESLPKEGGLIQASEDGNSISYITTGPSESEPEGNRSPAFTQNLARRIVNSKGAPEWSSEEIAIHGPERAPGVAPGKQQEYLYFSPDLTQALVEPVGRFQQSEPVLAPEASEKTIYIRDNPKCLESIATCYQPLVTNANDTAQPRKPFGGRNGEPATGLRFLGATSELEHVVLSSEVPLTSEATAQERNLYEWSKATGQLQLVNVLPESRSAPLAAITLGTGEMRRDAISSDGSHVVWTAEEKTVTHVSPHLYTRDMSTGTTRQVDAPKAGAELGEHEQVEFQSASANGSRVFFTDEQRLTPESSSPDIAEKTDLYVYEVGSGKLTDLTHARSGEPAGVQGLVLGNSAEGTIAYFVADGVLSENENAYHEKATPGRCVQAQGERIPGATCNLYVVRYNGSTWEAPSFIARLSNQDFPDWGAISRQDLGEVSASVSPNGRYLAFMSQRSLTGYDNQAINPAAGGARAEEVYLYDDEAHTFTCASCKATGERPNAVLDTKESGEGLGLVVDRPEAWENVWLAGSIPGSTQIEGQEAQYQSRYLANTGRLYFDSADALVPADENGKEDVYELEQAGEGTCQNASGCVNLLSSGTSAQESAFIDANTSGSDVFFVTSAQLVPSDKDTNFDVYDARVCTSSSPCVKSETSTVVSCESSEACKGPSTSGPAYGTPATAVPSGSGNLPPQGGVLPTKALKSVPKLTRAQKLAKALKACRKLRNKKKRVLCERSARKSYGPPAKKKGKK